MSLMYNNQLAGQFGHIYKTVGSTDRLSTGVKRKNPRKSASPSKGGPKVIRITEKTSQTKKSSLKKKKTLPKKASSKKVTFSSRKRAPVRKKKSSALKKSKKRKRSILD